MNARQAFNRLFGFPDVQGGNVPGWPDSYQFHPYRLDRLAWDYPKAVRQVVTVHACVMRIAEDLAQLPLLFERESGADWMPVKRLPGNIVDVWAKANDEQTSYELVRDLHAHLKGSGNAYLVAETFSTKKVHELYLMHPQLTQVIPGRRRSEAAYLFNRGGRLETVDGKCVVHFRNYNPDFEPYGASDLECVEEQYSARYDIGRLMGLFTRGGGVPAGYFSVIGPDGQASGGVLPEPDQKRLQSQIMRLFNGIKNAFRPKILSAVKWDRMGLTPKEMNLIEQANLADADICRALGVPPWMVGIKDNSGGLGASPGAAAADRSIYIRNTIMPQVAFRDAVLTERLVPMFGEVGVRARTDLSSVQELFLPLVNSAQQVVSLAGGVAVFSVNELRKMYGQPAREEPEADELAEKPAALGAFGAPAAEEPAPPAEPKTAPVKKDEARTRMIDGDESRERKRKKASADLVRYERKVTRLFQDILGTQQARIIARLEKQGGADMLNGAASKRGINVDEIVAPDPSDEEALRRLLAQLVVDRGEEALADLALELQLDLNSSRAAAFVTRQAQRSLALTEATTREAVRKQISEGLALNETTGQIVARISEMPEFGQARALTIARTETVSAYNFATHDAWEQSGVVEQIEWLSSRDSAVRESHADADGDKVSLGQSFDVGGAALAFPGDPSGPPEETINCFVPDTNVSGEFVGGLKVRYTGPVRVLVTARGHRLTVTPNHPVLTDEGWRPAGDVRKGDQLFSDGRSVNGAGVQRNPYDYDAPACIEDVFNTLAANAGSSSRVAGTLDLHSDAAFTHGEIDVVSPDGELLRDLRAARAKLRDDGCFVLPNVQDSLVGDLSAQPNGFDAVSLSASGRMSGGDLSLDGGGVALDVSPLQVLRFGAASHWNASSDESARQHGAADPGFVGQLLQAASGLVTLDEVIEVRDFAFGGHVYDLQSVGGWILASGIVCSNCRCTTVPVVNEKARARKQFGKTLARLLGQGVAS